MKAQYAILAMTTLLSSLASSKNLTVINEIYVPIKAIVSHKDLARDKLEYEEAIINPEKSHQFTGYSFFSIKWYYSGVRCYANIPTSIPLFDGKKSLLFNPEITLYGNRYSINFDQNGKLDTPKTYDAQCHYVGEEGTAPPTGCDNGCHSADENKKERQS